MGYFMYVCPECRKVFKVQGNDKKVKCSNCANILKDMRVAVEEWEVMSGLFCVPVDVMLRGNRKYVFLLCWDDRCGRLYMYYERLMMIRSA